MASKGIRDRVAIVGMGCTPFGEHWDKGAEDLLDDSATAAFDSAGVAKDDVDAFWLGTMGAGISGLTLSRPLKLDYKPVTRRENMCATGSEAFRNASYAVASGAVDMAMAIGVEKLKDSGFSGLVVSRPQDDGTAAELTAPALFSLLAPAYSKKYGVDKDELKQVLTRIAWKNHKNGAVNPRAELAMAEVHDCFTPTELVLMEDLGFAERGTAWKEVLAGTFDLDGELPVNPDGGLKAFGHPIGASGLRMLFECWLQLRGEAPPERTIKSIAAGKKLALTHNLGGSPGECVSFVSVVGSEPAA